MVRKGGFSQGGRGPSGSGWGRVGSGKAVKVRRGRSRSVPVCQGGPVPVG